MEETTNTKLTIFYNSESLGEQVAIEDMNPQQLLLDLKSIKLK